MEKVINYRGISLLDTVYKVLSIETYILEIVGEY